MRIEPSASRPHPGPNGPNGPNASELIAAILAAAESDLGRPLVAGTTTVVPATDRSEATQAVYYQLRAHGFVWCNPAHEERLAGLAADTVLDLATQTAFTPTGAATMRVLDGKPQPIPELDARYEVRRLEPDEPDDRQLLVALMGDCSADDLDEAELDLGELDDDIWVVIDDGRIVAEASARPFVKAPRFDDIGVVTHPARRNEGLGRHAVAAYIFGRPDSSRPLLYRHDPANLGSAGIASSLGFAPVVRVAALTVPDA